MWLVRRTDGNVRCWLLSYRPDGVAFPFSLGMLSSYHLLLLLLLSDRLVVAGRMDGRSDGRSDKSVPR